MRLKKLYDTWSQQEAVVLSDESFKIKLPKDDVARIEALAKMFPKCGAEGIITDLLSAALRDMEELFPYVQGDKVISHDEEGNAIYEDVGPTPRYLTLLQQRN